MGLALGLALFAWLLGLRPGDDGTGERSTLASGASETEASPSPDASVEGTDPQRRSLGAEPGAPKPRCRPVVIQRPTERHDIRFDAR
jgi:hypothetical protein